MSKHLNAFCFPQTRCGRIKSDFAPALSQQGLTSIRESSLGTGSPENVPTDFLWRIFLRQVSSLRRQFSWSSFHHLVFQFVSYWNTKKKRCRPRLAVLRGGWSVLHTNQAEWRLHFACKRLLSRICCVYPADQWRVASVTESLLLRSYSIS